jgi:hypothetical protein
MAVTATKKRVTKATGCVNYRRVKVKMRWAFRSATDTGGQSQTALTGFPGSAKSFTLNTLRLSISLIEADKSRTHTALVKTKQAPAKLPPTTAHPTPVNQTSLSSGVLSKTASPLTTAHI